MNSDMTSTVGKAKLIRLYHRQQNYIKAKRIADFVLSLIALMLLSPLLLLVALAIKAESPSDPVIFKQKRMGLNGTVFTIYKFRTMKIEAPQELPAADFPDADEYMTALGRFLRKSSIDELPQIVNILRGDMSILGPRPLLLAEERVHLQRLHYGIYQVRPGLSGLAQIHGRDTLNDDCKVIWDRRYVEEIGLCMDVSIFFESIVAVLMRRGVVEHADRKV